MVIEVKKHENTRMVIQGLFIKVVLGKVHNILLEYLCSSNNETLTVLERERKNIFEIYNQTSLLNQFKHPLCCGTGKQSNEIKDLCCSHTPVYADNRLGKGSDC